MKGLLNILAGGFLVFMVVAVADEWDFFSTAWFGASKPKAVVADADRKDVEATLQLFHRISGHYYGSGGDPRFAERLPALEGVVRELQADVTYLRENGRKQELVLGRLDVLSVELLGEGRFEARTREYWHVSTLWIKDGSLAGPPVVVKSLGRYLVARGTQGLRVEAWDPVLDEEPGETPPA